MPIINTIRDYIIYSNMWVALGLAGFTATTNVLLSNPWHQAIIFNFAITLLAYNYMHWITWWKKPESLTIDNRQWLYKNKFTSAILNSMAIVIAIISIKDLLPSYLYFIGVIFFISCLYILPSKSNKGWRWIPITKAFIISLIWTSMSLAPSVLLNTTSTNIVLFGISYWLFIFGLTIVFDIQDLRTDPPHLRTIPQVLGRRKSIFLVQALLFISGTASLLSYLTSILSLSGLITYLTFISLSIILVRKAHKNQSSFFYSFWVESIPIAMASILCLISF